MDYKRYNEELAKSMEDKLWFEPHIRHYKNPLIVVDYGCGTNLLLQQLSGRHNIIPIGYDKNPTQLLHTCGLYSIPLYSNFGNLVEYVNALNYNGRYNVLLVLSSVLHEVYSDKQSIVQFENHLLLLNPDFVAVRDMMVSGESHSQTDRLDYKCITQRTSTEQLKSFESRWGSILNTKNFVHFLLKYKFVENWKHENNENYLSLSLEDHINYMSGRYWLQYFKHYKLPFLESRVKVDLGVEFPINTHVNIFWRKESGF